MSDQLSPAGDVAVRVDGGVAYVRLMRPPANFVDVSLLRALADVYEYIADRSSARVVVLSSEGKHFCAGANFSTPGERDPKSFYSQALRLFRQPLPVIALIQGATIGAGVGLALAADFRIATTDSRFAVNFSRLGIHQGFGISVTLPRVVGTQAAMDLLYTGREVNGPEAHALGLVDRVVPTADLLQAGEDLSQAIATSAPLALRSIRSTLRGDLAGEVEAAIEKEVVEQSRLMASSDFREGIAAVAARRIPTFTGR